MDWRLVQGFTLPLAIDCWDRLDPRDPELDYVGKEDE